MAAEPLLGERWLHEIEFGGDRTQLLFERGARALTRTGLAWSDQSRADEYRKRDGH